MVVKIFKILKWKVAISTPPPFFIFAILPEIIIVHKRPDFLHIRAQTKHKRSTQTEFQNSKLGGGRINEPSKYIPTWLHVKNETKMYSKL